MILYSPYLWLAARAEPVATAPTEISVDVVGPLAEIVLSRHFRSDASVPIDTELWFGLPAGATLDRFRLDVGGRVIESSVVRKAQAAQQYIEAANAGKIASLVEQKEPDLVVQKIANVLPGENIDVELHIVAPVSRKAGVWELVLPLTIAPRLQDPGGEGPVFVLPADPIPGRVDLVDQVEAKIHVESGRAVRWIESPTHAHRTRIESGRAELTSIGARADRDLVVRWGTSVPEAAFSLIAGDNHGLLLVEPPPPWTRVAPPASDIVLLVDVSDTMIGNRWPAVLRAVEIILAELRETDTLTVLVFSDIVQGLALRQPATFETLVDVAASLREVPLGGMTNLPLAMRFAMGVPSPAGRPRTVVLVSDGGGDRAVLDVLQEGTAVHTVGIGASTNRSLLEEIARRGAGVSVVASPEDELEPAMEGLLEALRGPVLTEARAILEGSSDPIVIPPMYADQMVAVPIRGVSCDASVRIEALYAGRPLSQVVPVSCTDRTRPLRVLWAHDRVAQLHAYPHQALAVALEYGIVTPYTSLIGIGSEIHNEGGYAAETTVGTSIDVDSTTTGAPLSKDFLQRIPAGRTYQSAVQTAPGVTGASGGNPNMGGGASNENTYLLDGANVTDPVSGTFALNFTFDPIESVDTIAEYMPEHPGAGRTIALVPRSGGNATDFEASLHHGIGASDGRPLRVDTLAALASGALRQDRLWLLSSYNYTESRLGERAFDSHSGQVRLTAQPIAEHRFTLAASKGSSLRSAPVPGSRLDAASGSAQWQWFYGSGGALETIGSTQHLAVDGEVRDRDQLQTQLIAPFGRPHAPKIGADLARDRWQLGSWSERWLGLSDLGEAPRENIRLGWFLQERYAPTSGFTVALGLRGDQTLGRPHLAPRLLVNMASRGGSGTSLLLCLRRAYGHLGLPTALLSPEQGLSRLDEASAALSQPLFGNIVARADVRYRDHHDLPVFGGGRSDLRLWSVGAVLERIRSRRWSFRFAWRYNALIERGASVLIDDGTLDGFTHTLDGRIDWDLPTDPFTQSVGLVGGWTYEPLGTRLPDPLTGSLPNVAGWSLGASFGQKIDVRKGLLQLGATGRYVRLWDDGRDLGLDLRSAAPVLLPPALSGPRLDLSLEYTF